MGAARYSEMLWVLYDASTCRRASSLDPSGRDCPGRLMEASRWRGREKATGARRRRGREGDRARRRPGEKATGREGDGNLEEASGRFPREEGLLQETLAPPDLRPRVLGLASTAHVRHSIGTPRFRPASAHLHAPRFTPHARVSPGMLPQLRVAGGVRQQHVYTRH
jgi:hypothetical protein